MKKIYKYAFWACLGLAPTNQLFAQTNTAVGNSAGGGGSDNSFFGYSTGQVNSSGTQNTFLGSSTGISNTTGNKNVFVGWYSGNSTTTGFNNLFVGSKTGKENTTGYRNTFIGPGAGLLNVSGYHNTALGYLAGRNNQVGNNNVYLGPFAGYSNLGSSNVFIGNQAGYYETGSNKLYIDNSSTSTPLIQGDFSADQLTVNGDLSVTDGLQASSISLNGAGGINFGLNSESILSCNETRWHFELQRTCGIGPLPPPFKAMTLRYAGDGIDLGVGTQAPQYKLDVNGRVRATQYLTFSDKRLKQDIQSIENASELLSKLEGVTYSYRQDLKEEGRNLAPGKQIGFIAQDVQKVLPEIVAQDKEGYLSVSYQSLIPLLVESQNELKSENDELKAMLKETQEVNKQLQLEMESIKALLSNMSETMPTTTVQLEGEAKEMLLQNAPNPFTESTKIEYDLPADCSGSQLLITDANGVVIKTIEVLETGRGRIVLEANSLAPGNYRYTLVCQGQTLASKTMVIVR
ncbi:MAG: tail fiber domain-containing protein [Flavobacteriales bacterium]|nr:tail fiber domain-containing protein [Flavobacteriales bacterium]